MKLEKKEEDLLLEELPKDEDGMLNYIKVSKMIMSGNFKTCTYNLNHLPINDLLADKTGQRTVNKDT